MRAILACGLLGLLFLPVGCRDAAEPASLADTPSERARLLARADRGPVVLVFAPHPLDARVPDGVCRALENALREGPCSAALFFYAERERARRWLLSECDRRRQDGRAPRVILAGHSLGATAASELAERLLERTDDVEIPLLVTVDAIKTGPVGVTTGMGATMITLGNPIPGKHAYFVAYTGSPPAGGPRLRAHANYYQLRTKLYHGGPISGATENHRIETVPAEALNHGNVDDYAYPLVLGDLARAIREGGRP